MTEAHVPDFHRPRPASPDARRWSIVLAALLCIVAAGAVLLLRARRRHAEANERSRRQSEVAQGPRVSVMRVQASPRERTVNLSGDVRGFLQATVYAKLSGYVREMRVDRGDRVTKGQVLATIESPESQTDVASARHDAAITRINADRAERLAPSGVVAQQDRDNAVAQARIAQASLGRAVAILSYTVVRAPFTGVVTARYVDPGALLPAATGSTQSALPVVDVTDIDTLRVFVYVGQDAAPFVRVGDPVTIWQDEVPDKRIAATVTRSAGALDPRTRTMEVETDVDNRDWGLLPGTFAHVELRLAEPPSALIADEGIVIRDGKTHVVVIDGQRAHYVPVDLGYNDGRQVRVLRGLEPGQLIGLDVPVEVEEGALVQPVESGAGGGGGAGGRGGGGSGGGSSGGGSGQPGK